MTMEVGHFMNVCTHIHMNVCMYCMYCSYVCMHEHMNMYIRTYVCMHVHVHVLVCTECTYACNGIVLRCMHTLCSHGRVWA